MKKFSKPDYDTNDMLDNQNENKVDTYEDADIELTEDELIVLNNPDNLLNEVKQDLLKTKKYLDKKIYEAEMKSKSYDKFSQSIFLTKLELAKEKRQVLESLAKIAFEEKKFDTELSNTENIVDFMKKG